MQITIDTSHALPVYEQIVSQLTSDIQQGVLPVGTKLPTVRALALENGLAIGTVRQAYDTLQRRGFIVMHQGRGTFVRPTAPERLPPISASATGAQSRKQRAIQAVDRALGEILALGLTPSEARIFFDLRLRELEDLGPVIKLGVIECSAETLAEICSQIAPLPHVEAHSYLLDDVIRQPNQLTSDLDLLVLTTTHLAQLTERIDTDQSLATVVMTLSPDTAAQLARLPRDSQVGIFCGSQRFSGLIQRSCTRYSRLDMPPRAMLWGRENKLSSFLQEIDTLILPTAYQTLCPKEELSILEEALPHLKTVIYHYEMDQGSLLSLTNRIQQTLDAHIGT